MNQEKEKTSSSYITGYFVTQNEKFEKGMVVEKGRSGVYHQIEELISIINDCPIPKDNIDIVEVEVPNEAITNANTKRFRFKSFQQVKVSNVQTFQEVFDEMELLKVA